MLSKNLFFNYQQVLARCFLLLVLTTFVNSQRSQRFRSRSCSIVSIPHASTRFRHNYKIMRINCVQGFVLQGSNIVGCENGKWNSEIPVCAKEGCLKLESPENGLIIPMRYKTSLYCKENYKLVGGRVTYCNGTHWDRPLGTCEKTDDKTQLSCSFETDDLCGWSHDETHNFDWKRVMAVNLFQQFQTGPQFDHTTLTANSGHYMLMESFEQSPHSVARLISPIYSGRLTQNSACFKLYYFMYGAAVGDLNIYVKPVSVDIDKVLREPRYKHFGMSGNQGSIWKEAMFIIEQSPEDFQIIVEGTAGTYHLSDIAIDDVQIMSHSDCTSPSTTEITKIMEYTENNIYDVESCEGRCSESSITNYGIKSIQGILIKTCDCYPECENLNTCCPNYRSVCEFGNADSSTEWFNSVLENVSSLATTKHFSFATSTNTTSATQLKNIFSVSKQDTTSMSYGNSNKDIRIFTSTMALKHAHRKYSTTAKASKVLNTISSSWLESSTIESSSKETRKLAPLLPQKTYLNTPNNDITLRRKDKRITWQIQNYTFKQEKHPGLFIFTLLVLTISIAVLAFKHCEQMKIAMHFCFNRSVGENYDEESSLIYDQRNEAIV